MRFLILLSILGIIGCDTSTQKKVIATEKAPTAIGPYSQAIQVNNTLYLSGQALDPETRQLVKGGIEIQTIRVMQNLEAVLDKAGYGFGDVVQTQVFLADLNHYKPMNNIYAKYFSGAPPARAVVEASRIPRDALVEIMMVAQKP